MKRRIPPSWRRWIAVPIEAAALAGAVALAWEHL